MSQKTAPSASLILDWVYGYRGSQCHDNIYVNKDGNLVYFAAGLAVVMDAKNLKQQYYFEHDDDIISLTMNSVDKELIATGQIGKSPYICIWSSVTMETKSILKDQHTHGICTIAFCSDNKHLVSIGLDTNATMNLWEWKTGKVVATTRAHSERVFDSCFITGANLRIVTCGVKHIKFWTVSGNALTAKKGIFGKVGEIQTMLSLCMSKSNESLCYSGTASGDIYIWNNNTLDSVLAAAHKGAIYSIQSCTNGYIAGGKDGCVSCYDLSFNRTHMFNLITTPFGYADLTVRSVYWSDSNQIVVGTLASDIFVFPLIEPTKIHQLVSAHGTGELWALAVHPKKPIFATASDDCCIKIWVMNDKTQVNRVMLEQKIRSCSFSGDGGLLAVGLIDGSFRVLRCRDMSEEFRGHDRKEVIHEMKFSFDNKWLAVGSNDNFVDIYDINNGFKRMGICKGNSSFITHLDWSKDSQYIRTNSGAAELLIFRAPTGEHVIQSQILSTIQWNQSTGVLGNDIQGIWEKYTDTNDINAADVNFHVGLVATGDDFGLVKLFKYPCPMKGAHFRKYTGHCAHVTNVRWSFDGRFLISIGGSDQSIFQWRLESSGALTGQHPDSVTEGSDSGLSDIEGCDSQLEAESQAKYERVIDKTDASRLQKVSKTDLEPGQKRKKAPSNGIELEWVHGYRGYDCRCNLFYLQSGIDMVYHVAAVGIVMNRQTRRQRFYTGHTDDILCLSLHPVKDYVATGQVGKEPTIHIWDATTMQVISILKGEHERGICAVDFSNDGRKLVSVGLDDNHCLVVWDWRKGEKLASTRGHKDKIFVVKWSPHNNNLLVAVGVKYIRFWSQAGGGFTSQRGTFGQVGKLDSQLCVVFDSRPDKSNVCYTGCATGHVYIWHGNVLQRSLLAHQNGGCYAIDAVDKGFVTGGKDGTVNLYNEEFSQIYKTYKLNGGSLSQSFCPTVRSVILGKEKILVGTHTGEILEISSDGEIQALVNGHGQGELWGLAIDHRNNQCLTVSDDAQLMIWHIEDTQHRLVKRKKIKGPARCCDVSFDGTAIAIGYRDGSFEVLSMQSLEQIATNHHRKEEISDIKFSPEPGKYLAVGSHDNFVDIYSTASHKRLSVCKGASSYITHIDWDMNGKLLMLNSGAREQLFYEAPRGTRQTVSKSEQLKIQWYSWTGVLGDSCLGLWPPKCDITDINGTCLSSDGSIIATGDDFGRVKLFDYPASTKFAKYKQYCAHSAHVTNVRWSRNDDYLVSVGGGDTAVMLWRHKRQALPLSHRSQAEQNQIQQSDMSDTDSEEENGYDSDVEREKNMDYASKTYSSEITELQKETLKLQQDNSKVDKSNLKKVVSRNSSSNAALVQPVFDERSSKVPKPIPALNKIDGLQLTHIHGYRGFDCRNNLHYLMSESSNGNNTSIVYHAAAVGIVHNLTTGQQSFFTQHLDDILCLTVNRHPKFQGLVASGELGNLPLIHIWRATDLTLVSTIQGKHTHGICSLNFSGSGTLLLSVGIDPNHTILVTKWQEGNVLASIDQQSQRIFLAEFRPDSDKVFVDVGVKHVKFWTLAGSQLVQKRGSCLPAVGEKTRKMTTMLSVAFGPDDVTYTGAMNGDVWVWQKCSLLRVVEQVHSGPVFVLYTTLSDGLIVSGGKEKGKDTGSVKLWDQKMSRCKPFHLAENTNFRGSSSTTGSPLEDRSLEVIRSISRVNGDILVGTQDNDIIKIDERKTTVTYLLQSHGEGLLCGLSVHPYLPMYASASEDGTVKIWDLNTKMLIQSMTTGPATSVAYCGNRGQYLSVGLKSGACVVLCSSSYRLLARRKDRARPVTQMSWCPTDTTILAVASGDDPASSVIDIYRLESAPASTSNTPKTPSVQPLTTTSSSLKMNLQRLAYCKDLVSPVQSLDYSVDGKQLRVGLTDLSVLLVDVANGQILPANDRLVLSSWTSIAGTEVSPLWKQAATSKSTDMINCAVVNTQCNALASGDDMGLVKLYSGGFPLVNGAASAPPINYQGHSAHVTNVKFTSDDSHLLSTGGDDCCVFVWKCK